MIWEKKKKNTNHKKTKHHTNFYNTFIFFFSPAKITLKVFIAVKIVCY